MFDAAMESSAQLARSLVSVDDAADTADNRDFQTVTIALSVGFVVVFWCFIAMGSCATCYLKDQELRREVVALQAQGIEIQLADLKRKQSKAKRGAKQASRSKQSDVEMKENEDSDDDEDWFEEEDIDDREEVIRRTLYYKTYMFLTATNTMAFVLTVVFVDLIVAICAEAFDPSEQERSRVEIFGLATVAFFFVEVAVRWRTYAYVKNSYCRFLKSHLNKLDVFVVAVDIVLAIVINVLMSRLNSLSGDAATSEQYAPLVSGLRILRLFRLFRVVRAVRVLRRLAQEVQGTAEGYESHVEFEDFEDPETIIERMADNAVEQMQEQILNDLLERAQRLEQSSWFHFNEKERAHLTSVYNMFTVTNELHRMDLYAALRRFGCKVNVSQARFLTHEFDTEGKGTFSLKQFICLAARAQVVAKYEPRPDMSEDGSAIDLAAPVKPAGMLVVPPPHRGLSMIEVRALVDVFDELDEGAPAASTSTSKASLQLRDLKAKHTPDTLFASFPNDGLLDKAGLVTAIRNGGYNPTLMEVKEYMATYDPQNTGWVTKQDFLIIMGRVPTAQGTFSAKQYAKIVQLFDMYDVDQTGLISFVELKALMWRLDLHFRKGAAAVIIDRLFPTGQNTPLDKQTVVSVLSHAKARREQYVRGGPGLPETFSAVLDAAEVGEDLSRVPKVPPGVLTLGDRALVMQTFEHFDSTGSGTVPRYLFKKCMRMLGFYQIESSALDLVARKIPPHKDGRMDFPEFFALIGFVMQNGKRGLYGDVIGTVFETPPDEPEAIEDVLAVVCEPAFLAQFTQDLAIDLATALPAIAAYVDEMVPSASCLYEWMEGVLRQGHTTVPLERFVEVIHDVGEKYYAEFDARARRFHAEQLHRWVGQKETKRCAVAFEIYTDKSSVLNRQALGPMLSDLGYPVMSHEDSKAVLYEFTHPKDKANVLFPELLHCLKTLNVVRFRAEDRRGDFLVDARGIVKSANGDGFDGASSPLHANAAPDDSLLASQGVDVERVAGAPATTTNKPKKGAREAEGPSGGYMLVAKNLLKKKMKKMKARDEVDEEGYVIPKSAYELFVLTNPTADQVELLNQWANLMTDTEKLAFEREAHDMRRAYDNLKGGVTGKEAANEFLKRKKTGHNALSKGGANKGAGKGEGGARSDLEGAEKRLQALEKSMRADALKNAVGDEVYEDRRMDELIQARKEAKIAEEAAKKAAEEAAAADEAALLEAEKEGDLKFDFRGQPLAEAAPLALSPVETQVEHVQTLATAAPPPPPAASAHLPEQQASRRSTLQGQAAPAKHRSGSIVVPPGLSASGVPAELTAHASDLDAGGYSQGAGSNTIAQSMPHIVGPVTSFAPPPPPSATGGFGSAPPPASSKGMASARPSLALPSGVAPPPPMGSGGNNAAIMGGPMPFGGGGFMGGGAPPPPPPGAFRR